MAETGFGGKGKGEGIFTRKELTPPDIDSRMELVNLDRRLKMLEEGFTNIRRRFQVTEENMLSKNKHLSTEIKTMTSEMNELRKEIFELKDKLLLMIKELQECAKKEDVRVLEKYINMWNPVNFVTKNDVDDIVKSALRNNTS